MFTGMGAIDSSHLLVVGAGPGLGASVARRFAREGYRLTLVARSQATTAALADELRGAGTDVTVVTADAGDPDNLRAALAPLFARPDAPGVVIYSAAFAAVDDLLSVTPDRSWASSLAIAVSRLKLSGLSKPPPMRARRWTMNKELGVWTGDDCALVLIDYQKEQLESIRSETGADLVALHARWLARTARAFDVPIVLSTVGVEYGFNSPTDPTILAEMPGIEPIDRSSMNAFEDQAFREAVEATGRKRLIFGALQTEVCLAFAVVDALKDGYDAMFVTDATGSRSQVEHRTAIERLSHAGAVPNTAVGVVCELFRDWAGPLGDAAREATGWYFIEVAKVTDEVGIAEAERLRAQAPVAQ